MHYPEHKSDNKNQEFSNQLNQNDIEIEKMTENRTSPIINSTDVFHSCT